MARLYSRYAWSAYKERNWQEFENLVDKGVEFDADNPDLLSFQGILYYRNREFQSACRKYEESFRSSESTAYLSREEVLSPLAEIMYRLGKYQELIDLYQTLGGLDRVYPDFLFYTVQSLYLTGKKEDAEALAEEGVYRFQDQRFLILLCGWGNDPEYSGILNEFLDRQGMLYPDLMTQVILQDGKGRDFLSFQYMSRIRDFNSWYFSNQQLNLDNNFIFYPREADQSERVWPEKVIQEVWKDLIRQEGSLNSQALPELLLIDQSGDGVEDWEIRNEDGRSYWTRDEDQDGSADFRILWSEDRKPSAVEYFGKDSLTRFHYYEYPHIESIEVEGHDRNQREYLYLPGSYSLPIFNDSEISWFLVLSLGSETLPLWMRSGESGYLKECYSLRDSVTEPEFRLFREYTVINGTIRRFREDSNFDGYFDRTVLLKDWLPYEGYRDLNSDGQFDMKELYTNGRLTGLDIQGEKSRIEEYYDLWDSKRYQLWDFDRTSFYDAVLVQTPDLIWNEYRLDSDILMESGETEQ